MKKIQRILASAILAGTVLASVAPSAMAATTPFTDVTGQYVEPVSYLYSNRIFKGVSPDKFGVHQNIKRVDAAVIIANSIGYLYDIPYERAPFKDLPSRAINPISYLKAKGIVNGKTQTLFGAEDSITRGEAAVILSRAYQNVLYFPRETFYDFTDVPDQYAEAVNSLVATRIVQGKTETAFGTHLPLTRGELAVMVYRLEQTIDVESDINYSPYDEQLPSAKDGISLTTDKESYSLASDKNIKLTITNTGSSTLNIKHYPILEKHHGFFWIIANYKNYVAYPKDAIKVEPGTSREHTVNFEDLRIKLTPGKYRLRQHFLNETASSMGPVLSTEFIITE